ncbi:MAG: hypothetical protein AAF937_08330 [Planctomycetota bacterium]
MADEIIPAKRNGGPGKIIAVGCLTVVFIVIILGVIGGVAISTNWPAIEAKLREWGSSGVTEIMANGIRDTDLTNEQKRELIARVDAMGDEFKAGTLTIDDLKKIGETLETSPLIPIGIVEAMNAVYIKPSDLTDEEKAEAMRLNQRLARGMFEERITPEELEPVLEPISTGGGASVTSRESGDGEIGTFRINDLKDPEKITADELRQYMANARSLLEQKAIADEPFEIDVVEEFDKVIEEAIGRRIVPAQVSDESGEEAPEPASTGAGG